MWYPDYCTYPRCDTSKSFYKNNRFKRLLLCKICDARFSLDDNCFFSVKLRYPHWSNTLILKKKRKHFIIHKSVDSKCLYYLHNLKKDYSKNKYKLHYIYHEFTMDFYMNLNTLLKKASSFSKHNAHVMSLCLTLHINLTGSERPVQHQHFPPADHQLLRERRCPHQAFCWSIPLWKKDAFTTNKTYIMSAVSRSIIGYQGCLTNVALVLASSPCAWHSRDLQSSRKTLSSLLTAIMPIFSLQWNSEKILHSRSHNSLDFPITMLFLQSTTYLNKWLSGWTIPIRHFTVTQMALTTSTTRAIPCPLDRTLYITFSVYINTINIKFSIKWSCCRILITCQANNSFLWVNRTVEYWSHQSGCENILRRSIGIKLMIILFQQKRENCVLFLLFGKNGCEQSPLMSQGTDPLWFLRAKP